MRPKRLAAAGFFAVAFALAFGSGGALADVDPCNPLVNEIVCENSKPGTPTSVWDISGDGDDSIQGFATETSVNRGETVRFKVKTDASVYTIQIYRLGWYGGDGAREVATVTPSAALPQGQPACLSQASSGLVDCGNWAESASWQVPADAVSGVYVGRLRRPDTGGKSHIIFVVRDDEGASELLFQTADTTWQAYNRYGGNSLYVGQPAGRAYKVSYNRPFTTRQHANHSFFFSGEYPLVRFLERNGYDVSYTTGVDSDRRGAEIAEHRAFVSVGHDEYWSAGQRAAVEAARAAGVHLAFFSGNEVFWKTRFEPAIDASAAPYRTLVSYKETSANAKIDPSPAWTGTWRDPRFSPPADGGKPENALTGTLFMVNGYRTDAITVPAAYAGLRLWRNTSVASLPAGGVATFPAGTLGYEWDEDVDNSSRPAGLVRLSKTTVDVPARLTDYGSTYAAGTATHSLTLYRAQSGALVFGAGTIQWAWGLDEDHDTFGSGPPEPPDARMQQATVNLLADMGAQPGTLQAGLTPASASTDTAAPSSTITSPANGATVSRGSPVTITGTASDVGGAVGAVEVSVDGGATWHPADGGESWSYTWTGSGFGSVTIKARAVDDSGNIQSTPTAATVTVGCPCSIWSSAAVPAIAAQTDTRAVEVGVKFRSDVAGYIAGLRFHKGAPNTGSHMASLWTGSGTLLARAPFTNETASGWQEVTFDTPVAVTAGTTYVASYHAPVGRYSQDRPFFGTAGVDNAPLHALRDGVDGGNGVFSYSSTPAFPTSTSQSANYWVDVVFVTQVPPDTKAPTVTVTTPPGGSTSHSIGSNVRAVFSEGIDPATVTATTFELRQEATGAPLPAGVSYDAATRAGILDPASGLAYSTTYTATLRGGPAGVKDLAGNPLASDYSWTFTTAPPPACPCTIWSGSAVPATASHSDTKAVEVGVKFRSESAGVITGLRFYKGSLNTGTHVASLWTRTGTLLARATFKNETPSGWQEVKFPAPVAIAADTTYIASYYAPVGRYSLNRPFFVTGGVDNPPLSALKDGVDGGNGVFTYSASPAFPTSSSQSSNYWVDVVFVTSAADTTPPSVDSVSPAAGATGVDPGAKVTATMDEPVDPATVTGSTVALREAGSGTPVPASVSYDEATRKATLNPSAPLILGKAYTATVNGGSTGVKDLAGNPLTGDYSWTFTARACPCSIWSAATVPATASHSDTGAVEVGVKFRTDVDGFINGIRFYKGSLNTGTHVGSLWTSTGTLLARATFTNETASGWQQVLFDTPVAVSANTTYVASYHAPVGRYARNRPYFGTAGVDAAPLHALKDGVDGGNGVFVYSAAPTFPTSTSQAANYWVDVVFVVSAP